MSDPFLIVIGVIVVFALGCIWIQTLMAASQRGYYRGWEAACAALSADVSVEEYDEEDDNED